MCMFSATTYWIYLLSWCITCALLCSFYEFMNVCIYRESPIFCVLDIMNDIMSVSYTHLDVYKRQLRRTSRCFLFDKNYIAIHEVQKRTNSALWWRRRHNTSAKPPLRLFKFYFRLVYPHITCILFYYFIFFLNITKCIYNILKLKIKLKNSTVLRLWVLFTLIS